MYHSYWRKVLRLQGDSIPETKSMQIQIRSLPCVILPLLSNDDLVINQENGNLIPIKNLSVPNSLLLDSDFLYSRQDHWVQSKTLAAIFHTVHPAL